MAKGYKELTSYPLAEGTPVFRYRQGLPEHVTMDDPAVNVMTDLRRVKVVTVAPETGIDAALEKMKLTEVRLLIVTDSQHHVVGLVSARDLMGEKPVSYVSRERVSRSDVQVAHVMTPREQIDTLDLEDVMRASVGDVVTTLKAVGRQHALVVDRDAEDGSLVRGIFSATQIGAQLGVEIPAEGRVQSFAELEAMLVRASPAAQ